MKYWLRRGLRAITPMPLRERIAAGRRYMRDLMTGDSSRFASRHSPDSDEAMFLVCEVRQPIRRSPEWEGKLTNLRRAVRCLDGVIVGSGELFSFWHLTGRPSAKRGFARGRSIRAGVVRAEIGGGLCQLSGVCYELVLRAGAEIAERYPHSRDLYDEDSRHTPLGLDATVMWGFKDFRFRNTADYDLKIRLQVDERWLTGRILAARCAQPHELMLQRYDDSLSGTKAVKVYREDERKQWRIISHDIYVTDERKWV